MKSPYEILGVAKTATQDEIKKAYRTLAKTSHPDLNPGNKVAENRFKEINSAYELIGSPETRAKFDSGEIEAQERQAQQNASYYQSQQDGGRYAHGFSGGAENIFEQFFRSGGRGKKGFSAEDFDTPGEDHLYQMEVDFKDAALGAEREITLPNGKKLSVKIPAGIETGTKLRFKNQGGPGVGKGTAGHAFVEISIRSLEGFTRNGKTIESELPISFQEGLLGGEVKVPTIDGQVMLKLQPGVSTGARMRIRGKGAGAGSERGDQIVVIKVVLPKIVDPELQTIIRNWGEKFSYNPRSEK